MTKYITIVVLLFVVVAGIVYYLNTEENIVTKDKTAEELAVDIPMEVGTRNGTTSMESMEGNKTGVHIIPDGSIIANDSTILPDARILPDGTIELKDGTIVKPTIDMRPEESAGSNSANSGVQIGASSGMVIGSDESEHHTFDIIGTNYEFSIKQIKVKKGDTVTINLTADEGYHDWVIDKFGAATERVIEGSSTSVTFVADKAGLFQYYCSVGDHRARGMFGYLIVEE